MVLLLFPATFLVLFTVIFLCHGPCISVSEIILCVVVFSQPTHKDSSKHKVRIQKKNGRYYFQHPYARLFVAYFVIFCNFLIYAEDPVSHSRANCTIPVIGNDYAFVTYRYCTESMFFHHYKSKTSLRCHCKTFLLKIYILP